jgi:hypothetical protein
MKVEPGQGTEEELRLGPPIGSRSSRRSSATVSGGVLTAWMVELSSAIGLGSICLSPIVDIWVG